MTRSQRGRWRRFSLQVSWNKGRRFLFFALSTGVFFMAWLLFILLRVWHGMDIGLSRRIWARNITIFRELGL
jgi:hypothetical protein